MSLTVDFAAKQKRNAKTNFQISFQRSMLSLLYTRIVEFSSIQIETLSTAMLHRIGKTERFFIDFIVTPFLTFCK